MPLVVVVAVFHRGDREHQDEWDEGAGHGDGRHCRVQLEELQHGKVDVARAVVRALSVVVVFWVSSKKKAFPRNPKVPAVSGRERRVKLERDFNFEFPRTFFWIQTCVFFGVEGGGAAAGESLKKTCR